MKSNRFELETKSKLENLLVISDFVAEAMKQLGADSETIFKVQMAVDEACANIIQHACLEQEDIITLTLELVNDNLVVTIRDRGKPFDPRSVPPPDLEAGLDKRKIGGLGIYFMRKLMDEVGYNFDAKKGNTLIMRKRLNKMTLEGRATQKNR